VRYKQTAETLANEVSRLGVIISIKDGLIEKYNKKLAEKELAFNALKENYEIVELELKAALEKNNPGYTFDNFKNDVLKVLGGALIMLGIIAL
jgi:hypothetical protein